MSTPHCPTLRVLMVDDEPLALVRMRTLLAAMQQPAAHIVGEATSAQAALPLLAQHGADVVLLDIHMPGHTGLELARHLRTHHPQCQIIFVTAHSHHALDAFDLDATDYLTKPVRRQRLHAALLKVLARQQAHLPADVPTAPLASPPPPPQPAPPVPTHGSLILRERGRVQRIALDDVVFAQAELKYVTLHMRDGSHCIWDGTIQQLEQEHHQLFLRIHRSTLVRKDLLLQCKKRLLPDGGEGWFVQLQYSPQWLPVSRRLTAAVRQALAEQYPPPA